MWVLHFTAKMLMHCDFLQNKRNSQIILWYLVKPRSISCLSRVTAQVKVAFRKIVVGLLTLEDDYTAYQQQSF